MTDPLRMHVEPSLEGATLVAAFDGWNDAGESATSAIAYLGAAIQAVPLAEIDGEPFLDLTVRRPLVRFDREGERVVEWPATHFRYGAHDGREIVVVHGIEPHLQWRLYCRLFADVVRRVRVKRVLLLGAYVADVVYSRPVGITGFSHDARLLEQMGVKASGYEGPTGIVGVLGDHLHRQGLEVLSLWAGLPHYISATPNPRGALALIQKLSQVAGLVVDTGPLERDAAAFEQRISALVSGDPELSEYVRQLKRREFAQ